MHDGAHAVSRRREVTAGRSTVASVGGWRLQCQPGSFPVSQGLGPAEGGLRARAGPGSGGLEACNDSVAHR
jgi:hypothetical protein